MAARKPGVVRTAPLSPSDYTNFPGPFSLNTKSVKKPRTNKSKPTPKPKKSGTNPGF